MINDIVDHNPRQTIRDASPASPQDVGLNRRLAMPGGPGLNRALGTRANWSYLALVDVFYRAIRNQSKGIRRPTSSNGQFNVTRNG